MFQLFQLFQFKKYYRGSKNLCVGAAGFGVVVHRKRTLPNGPTYIFLKKLEHWNICP